MQYIARKIQKFESIQSLMKKGIHNMYVEEIKFLFSYCEGKTIQHGTEKW